MYLKSQLFRGVGYFEVVVDTSVVSYAGACELQTVSLLSAVVLALESDTLFIRSSDEQRQHEARHWRRSVLYVLFCAVGCTQEGQACENLCQSFPKLLSQFCRRKKTLGYHVTQVYQGNGC